MKSECNQEHRLRASQIIVRYLAEFDPESTRAKSTGYLRSNGIQLLG